MDPLNNNTGNSDVNTVSKKAVKKNKFQAKKEILGSFYEIDQLTEKSKKLKSLQGKVDGIEAEKNNEADKIETIYADGMQELTVRYSEKLQPLYDEKKTLLSEIKKLTK